MTAVSTTTNYAPAPTEKATFNPVDPEAERAGLIVGVVFTVVLCVLFLGLGGFLYIRQRRTRNIKDGHDALRLRAKQNAGVYQETTSSENVLFSTPQKRSQGEYSSVSRKGDHYESDSSDEI